MPANAETHTGGCLCGAIRYEVTGPPSEVGYCHCRMCQKALGSVFGVFAIFSRPGFRFTAGEPAFYRSSPPKERGFCPACGSPLTMWNADASNRPHVAIMLGTLDHPEQFSPARYAGNHSGIESALPWLHIDDGLPRWRTEDDPLYIGPKGTP